MHVIDLVGITSLLRGASNLDWYLRNTLSNKKLSMVFA